MVRMREKLTDTLGNALDEITAELSFVRKLCEQKAEDYDIPMDDIIEELERIEGVIA